MAESTIDQNQLRQTTELDSGQSHTLTVDSDPALVIELAEGGDAPSLVIRDRDGREVARPAASSRNGVLAFSLKDVDAQRAHRAVLVRGDEPIGLAFDLALPKLETAWAGGAAGDDDFSFARESRDEPESQSSDDGDQPGADEGYSRVRPERDDDGGADADADAGG